MYFHLMRLNLIIQPIFSEGQTLQSSLLCNVYMHSNFRYGLTRIAVDSQVVGIRDRLQFLFIIMCFNFYDYSFLA
jgi:hypothetical protein